MNVQTEYRMFFFNKRTSVATAILAVEYSLLLFTFDTSFSCPSHCKVAGSNLTCRDDWKTRWPLHSVDLTSMGLSLPGQNIIHSPVARVVYE